MIKKSIITKKILIIHYDYIIKIYNVKYDYIIKIYNVKNKIFFLLMLNNLKCRMRGHENENIKSICTNEYCK